MKKKISEFVGPIENYSDMRSGDKFALAVYFFTEALKQTQASINDVREFYVETDVPLPANFGGEVRQLRAAKRIIVNASGYKLTRKSKTWAKGIAQQELKSPAATKSQSLKSLHPRIRKTSQKLYDDSHYSQAIFEAYKLIVQEVRVISGLSIDGKPLMDRAFSPSSPIISINKQQTQSEKDEQSGFMFLFGGAVLGIRNPKAHDIVTLKDPKKAFEYLAFASLLMRRLDEREEPK